MIAAMRPRESRMPSGFSGIAPVNVPSPHLVAWAVTVARADARVGSGVEVVLVCINSHHQQPCHLSMAQWMRQVWTVGSEAAHAADGPRELLARPGWVTARQFRVLPSGTEDADAVVGVPAASGSADITSMSSVIRASAAGP